MGLVTNSLISILLDYMKFRHEGFAAIRSFLMLDIRLHVCLTMLLSGAAILVVEYMKDSWKISEIQIVFAFTNICLVHLAFSILRVIETSRTGLFTSQNTFILFFLFCMIPVFRMVQLSSGGVWNTICLCVVYLFAVLMMSYYLCVMRLYCKAMNIWEEIFSEKNTRESIASLVLFSPMAIFMYFIIAQIMEK